MNATVRALDRSRIDSDPLDGPRPDVQIVTRPRVDGGWRAGRPVEDPHKVKLWGFVTAKPSEHLIHVRRGKVTRRSGQGATCFKWPWDSVAIVPTSLQELSFRADQVTSEKVGVEVVGLAVYRIADPLLAFRVLNFSFPERAQEKLERTLTSMFVGATRRIVATLPVEDCLRKRKAALAEELLAEIAPVVGGSGSTEDFTHQGWGVVIDTIEIQEVRVLSESVFAAMQAPYRAALDREAREARAVANQAIVKRETSCQRETELTKLRVEAELDQERTAADREHAEREAENQRRQSELAAAQQRAVNEQKLAIEQQRLAHQAELDRRRAELERSQAEAAARTAIEAAELAAAQAEATSASLPAQQAAQESQAELERRRTALAAELRRRAAEAARDEGLAQAAAALEQARASGVEAEAQARLELSRQLPAVAQALAGTMGEVKVTQIGGDQNPFAQVAAALAALLDVARSG